MREDRKQTPGPLFTKLILPGAPQDFALNSRDKHLFYFSKVARMATIAQDTRKGRKAKKLRGLQAISGLKLMTSVSTHGRIKQRLKRGMVICSYRCFHHSCLNAFVRLLKCQHKNRKDFGLGQMEND